MTAYEDQQVTLRCPTCGKVKREKRIYLGWLAAREQVAGCPPCVTITCKRCKTPTRHEFPEPEFAAFVEKLKGTPAAADCRGPGNRWWAFRPFSMRPDREVATVPATHHPGC